MMKLSFDPFPILSSERLKFRAMHVGDVHEVFAMRSDPDTMKFIPRPLAQNLDDALAHIKMVEDTIHNKQGINWAITLKNETKMIGIAGFYRIKPESYRSELGYMLLPEYRNQGYISEAIKTVLQYAFNQLDFNSIEAVIDPDNFASERVLQKNGFIKEAHLRENELWEGKFLDTVIYSLLKRNFDPNKICSLN